MALLYSDHNNECQYDHDHNHHDIHDNNHRTRPHRNPDVQLSSKLLWNDFHPLGHIPLRHGQPVYSYPNCLPAFGCTGDPQIFPKLFWDRLDLVSDTAFQRKQSICC